MSYFKIRNYVKIKVKLYTNFPKGSFNVINKYLVNVNVE